MHGDPKGYIFHTYFLEHVSPSCLFPTSELIEISEILKGASRLEIEITSQSKKALPCCLGELDEMVAI